MKVLVACEFSGIVRDAFIAKGHDAVSCDLLPTERPGPHIQGDVLEILNDGWDLMIAHPDCTRLCNSGVQWLHKRNLWKEMEAGALFFKTLLDVDIEHIAIENPVMHKYAVRIIGRRQDQSIQPWQFGEDASKRTCLWLRNLPFLQPTSVITKHRYANQSPSGSNKYGPSPDRWKLRSRTFQGIANAMAEQWG